MQSSGFWYYLISGVARGSSGGRYAMAVVVVVGLSGPGGVCRVVFVVLRLVVIAMVVARVVVMIMLVAWLCMWYSSLGSNRNLFVAVFPFRLSFLASVNNVSGLSMWATRLTCLYIHACMLAGCIFVWPCECLQASLPARLHVCLL